MTSSAALPATFVDISLDDFDPPIVYADQAVWSTPDPSADPDRFNQTVEGDWSQGTYHSTVVEGAELAFNFSGRSLEIHGTSTGFDAAFDVSLTSVSSGQPVSFQSNSSLPSGVLFAVGGLNPTDETTARVVNRAGNLTVDRAVYSAPVGAEGASLTETVLDETSPAITYSGTWESNSGEFFYGGSTTYTNEDGAAFAFNFTGSAVYIYGDQVNDHGLFSVTLDGVALGAPLSGASGCGGAFGKTCEKLGTLAWVRAGLGEGVHTVEVKNIAGTNNSFFDLDYIRYTTPSAYFDPAALSASTPASSASASVGPSSSSSAAPAGATVSNTPGSAGFARAGVHEPAGGWLALGALGLWAARTAGWV